MILLFILSMLDLLNRAGNRVYAWNSSELAIVWPLEPIPYRCTYSFCIIEKLEPSDNNKSMTAQQRAQYKQHF